LGFFFLSYQKERESNYYYPREKNEVMGGMLHSHEKPLATGRNPSLSHLWLEVLPISSIKIPFLLRYYDRLNEGLPLSVKLLKTAPWVISTDSIHNLQ